MCKPMELHWIIELNATNYFWVMNKSLIVSKINQIWLFSLMEAQGKARQDVKISVNNDWKADIYGTFA